MGNAGSDTGRLRTALKTGSYKLAVGIVRELPRISTADALELTLLAAKKDRERFDAMAVCWLVRLIEERAVTLNDVIWAGQRLRDERGGHDGRTGLENLLKQRGIW
jgi:hypothetical protein